MDLPTKNDPALVDGSVAILLWGRFFQNMAGGVLGCHSLPRSLKARTQPRHTTHNHTHNSNAVSASTPDCASAQLGPGRAQAPFLSSNRYAVFLRARLLQQHTMHGQMRADACSRGGMDLRRMRLAGAAGAARPVLPRAGRSIRPILAALVARGRSFSVDDLKIKRSLGEGSYGQVFEVRLCARCMHAWGAKERCFGWARAVRVGLRCAISSVDPKAPDPLS